MPEKSNGIPVAVMGLGLVLFGYLLLFSLDASASVLGHYVVLAGWAIAIFGVAAYLTQCEGNQARRVIQVGATISVLGLTGVVLANIMVFARILPERHQLFQFGISITISGLLLLLLGSVAQRGGLKRLKPFFQAFVSPPPHRRAWRTAPLHHAADYAVSKEHSGIPAVTVLLVLLGTMVVCWALAENGTNSLWRITALALGVLIFSNGVLAANLRRNMLLIRELQRSNAEILQQLNHPPSDQPTAP